MIQRQLNPLRNRSFFLFGARGTGKSTWLHHQFKPVNPFWVDLLDPDHEDRYQRNPKMLEHDILGLIHINKKPDWVIIDEVQKVPKLLDIVHRLIENEKIKFVLTGSSARKLKRGQANLLGGRALTYALFPLTFHEMAESFNLDQVLQFGSLPLICLSNNEHEKITLLRSYVQTYLKEEILIEQLVRNIVPFKGFLEISAQMNGQRLNYEKIAHELKVDNKTVQSYFDILEETYLGVKLPAFHRSIRKSQLFSPKFYWFDLGVQRFLSGEIRSLLTKKTFAYGQAFETFLINEILRYNSYLELDYKASYLQTKNGPEIDLILSRGKENIAIEIKSAENVDLLKINTFEKLASDIPGNTRLYCISQDVSRSKTGKVICVYWKDFFKEMER